jgi:hypothetical protein
MTARPLNVSRQNCWMLIARNMQPGDEHGKWQPVSVLRFTVICASKKDALEVRLIIGSSQFPPAPAMTDEAYSEYLDRFIKVRPYQASGKFEVWAHNWLRGWIPDIHELLIGSSESQYDVKPSERRITVVDERVHA